MNKHTFWKNIYWRLTGYYTSFKFGIVCIFIYHILFIISLLLLSLWYVIFVRIGTNSWTYIYRSISNILISFAVIAFLLKTYFALCIFGEDVNITNKFKWFILLETILNPLGITFSLYKLLHSRIYFFKKTCPFTRRFLQISNKYKNNLFPIIHKVDCQENFQKILLSVQNLSYKYHGSSKLDKFFHTIIKKINPHAYEKHMKYKNNIDYKDTELHDTSDFDILHNININLDQSKFIAILGCNGSGKSTFLKVINKLINNFRGKVFWTGKDIQTINNKSFAQNVANVPQQTIIYTNINVYDYVSQGLFPHEKNFLNIIDSKTHNKIIEKLALLNLEKYKNNFISDLSGGEKQKCVLARALVQNTKIIILDEPTTFLDIYSQYHVLELFKKIQTEENITIIAILHDIQQAIKFADDVILLDGGTIYKSGNTKSTLTEKNINYLFK